jgi:protein-tyrosine phosphatase
LKTLGITHVLTASHSLEYLNEPLRAVGIKQITFDVEDEDDQDLRPFLGTGSAFIAKAISGEGKVLVHCFSGVSRSATFMAHYVPTT